jgi:hypothetical protein
MDILILCLIVLMGCSTWIALRRSSRKHKVTTGFHHTVSSSSETPASKVEPPEPITIPDSDCGLFTSEDEHQAFRAGQPVWIRYEDTAGTVTERVVEIYRPGDGEVIFTWCRRKQAPRTFVRRNIRNWRLLPERFDFDPIVAQYWDEEGIRVRVEKNPWRRWLRRQPKEIADRYNY